MDAAPPPGGAGVVGCAAVARPVAGRDDTLAAMSRTSEHVTIAGAGALPEGPETPVLAGLSTEGSNPSPGVPVQGGRTFSEVRRDAMRLRTGQRGLVFDTHKSLSLCGLGRIPVAGENPNESRAHLSVDDGRCPDADDARCQIRGLTRCASPWACPVCAPKVATARAKALEPQISALLAGGSTAWLVTLTLRHARGDDLNGLFSVLAKAWDRLTSGKNGKALREHGKPQFIRGLDLTHSERHGWHPHVHVVLVLPPGHGDGADTARAFAARWRTVVGNLGFEALAVGQDVQRCVNAAAAAAYATTPAAVYEAVGIGTKTARDARSGSTAFDLLRAAVPPDGDAEPAAIARWCEYVAAVKGRRQTTVSRGLTLAEDAELTECDEDGVVLSDVVADLGDDTVAELDRTRQTAELLEAVEHAGRDRSLRRLLALDVLSTLRATDWTLRDVVRPATDATPPPSPPLPFAERGRLFARVERAEAELAASVAAKPAAKRTRKPKADAVALAS